MKNNDVKARLSLEVKPEFLRVATGFVEETSSVLGLKKNGAMALTLATEEVFSYLVNLGHAEQQVEISCHSGGYYVQVDLNFMAADFNMGAFNLTSRVKVDDQKSLDAMGLLIAARSVDHFNVKKFDKKGLTLSLIKEKKYPAIKPGTKIAVARLDSCEPCLAQPEEVKFFSKLLVQEYDSLFYLDDFSYPGKLLDMTSKGRFEVAVAKDRKGSIGGGLIWEWSEDKTVTCYGPYVFGENKDSTMADDLLEFCISALARSQALGLLNRLPTPELSQEHFDSLGTYSLVLKNGSKKEIKAYFRQMKEDEGEVVWTHPELEPFLKMEYKRLFLPREIRTVEDHGESENAESVLACEFSHSSDYVTLSPVRGGKDATLNITKHMKLLTSEKARQIYFEMDLGKSWQAGFYPGLIEQGFIPRLVLPHVGKGDVVFFQRGEA